MGQILLFLPSGNFFTNGCLISMSSFLFFPENRLSLSKHTADNAGPVHFNLHLS